MWLCLSNAFVSIVEPTPGSDLLRCRARRPGDLERVFPGCKVQRTPGRDYLFRTELPRETVAQAVAAAALGIAYGNFKDSVKDDALHGAYASVWRVMERLQPVPAYGRDPAPGFKAARKVSAKPARRAAPRNKNLFPTNDL